jgi:hypothetical protein
MELLFCSLTLILFKLMYQLIFETFLYTGKRSRSQDRNQNWNLEQDHGSGSDRGKNETILVPVRALIRTVPYQLRTLRGDQC